MALRVVMNNLVERIARRLLPGVIAQDPAKRAEIAAIQNGLTGLVWASIILVFAAIALLILPDRPRHGTAILLLLAAWAGPIAMRALRHKSSGLWVAFLLPQVLLGAAVFLNAQAGAALIWALLAWPVLAMATGAFTPVARCVSASIALLVVWAIWAGAGSADLVLTGAGLVLAVFLLIVGAIGTLRLQALGKHQLQSAHDAQAQTKAQMEALTAKLSKYLSPQLYASIFEGKQDVKLGATRKKLTVYFSDIVDFTRTTEEMDAEDLAHLMNDYFENMAEIILKHGGTIDKYMGDAIMVFFGDPESRGTAQDAVACVRMAIEMEERLRFLQGKWMAMGLTQPVRMRAGINSGYCTVGNFGSENRMDYTIIGGQVNVAARLENVAEPGTILVSQNTYALVRDHFAFEDAGSHQVKGLSAPIEAYQLRDVGGSNA